MWAVSFAALVTLGVYAAWMRERQPLIHTLDGMTMGSTWSVRVAGPYDLDTAALRVAIEAELAELDTQLSGYRESGRVSELNRSPPGEWLDLPPHLGEVIRFGRRLHDETGGAFDLTVKPLVNLWGFGAAEPRSSLPTDQEIADARSRLGSDELEISEDGSRIRKLSDVHIDVDAVAPGYVADVVSALMVSRALPDHLVEIGGELRARGRRIDGSAWRVGIERPLMERGRVDAVIAVSEVGVATSGDYRDFVEIGGSRYSHTIDPSTGRPVNHRLASVTVIAPDALTADGYSTVLMVFGPEKGLQWAEARNVPVFMVVRSEGDRLEERYNAAFTPYLVD